MLVDDTSAPYASKKMLAKAVWTDCLSLIVVDIFIPDAISTVLTDDRVGLKAARAESLVVEGGTFTFRNFVPTDGTDSSFGHGLFLLVVNLPRMHEGAFRKIISNSALRFLPKNKVKENRANIIIMLNNFKGGSINVNKL